MSHTAKVIAVLGRTVRAGRWKLTDDSLVIAVFGRCVLDLSRAYVDEEDDELTMTVFALFGSVSIVLPPGCDVEPSGIALLASSEVEIPSDKPADLTLNVLAPLEISWFAMFGRVRINELALEIEPENAASGDVLPEDALAKDVLAEPAVEVFVSEAVEPPAEPEAPVPDPVTAAEEEATAAAEAQAEQAALQNEIAQWRSETGRSEPESRASVDPRTEILADDTSEPAESEAR